MKYVIDLDGTLCNSRCNDYSTAIPNLHRIHKVNQLRDGGHTIVIYTARGMGRHGEDEGKASAEFRSLTEAQLEEWGVLYDELIFGKPSGDVYIDDKATPPESFFDNHYVRKNWGYELWIVNKPEYCGKILYFKKDKACSYHYHVLKDETFYVKSGRVVVEYGYDDDVANAMVKVLDEGDIMHIPPNLRHRISAGIDSEVFEFSTQHLEEDTYRIIGSD